MRKVFQMLLLCAVIAIGFNSCEKEVTYTLTNKTVWRALFSFTSITKQMKR